MKFNIVLGNPPYNNDIYLDFVQMGYSIATKYSVFITPAKWQAKGGAKNEHFRETIVPHMSKIVYYPVATDIFSNIKEWDGISYYLIDKDMHDLKQISNKCIWQKLFNNEKKDIIFINLNNAFVSIIQKVINLKHLSLANNADWFGCKQLEGGNTGDIHIIGGDSQGNPVDLGLCDSNRLRNKLDVDKYKAIMHIMPGRNGTLVSDGTTYGNSAVKVLGPKQIPRYKYLTLFCEDLNKVNNFVSYMNTKFIRALFFISVVGSSITEESWRYIPDPGTFNKIFEDKPLPGYTPNEQGEYTDKDGNVHCSLYVKYKLTPEEINIIESVIKERK
jgi:hypothetical protein